MPEPKYLKNICPVCHEPQLGSHYHESTEAPIDVQYGPLHFLGTRDQATACLESLSGLPVITMSPDIAKLIYLLTEALEITESECPPEIEAIRADDTIIAYRKQASDSDVVSVMGRPREDEDGRSGFYWFRLTNGDLILGLYPRGDTYLEMSCRNEV